ncbi:MAG: sigma 54-interacting transcriptional regulator, partial [Firmicutes bacterium]|nr:sigma 54-interacting transcriptional regulator [Bacillota bacterium]
MVLDTKKPVTLVQETLAGKRLLVNSNPIFDDRGNLVRIINSSTDVTELNHLRQQLARTQSLVERYRREIDGLRSEMGEPEAPLARSPKMREVLTLVENIAEVDTTVLILGESGVGKEVLARYIHRRSRRKDQPFVVINCGAIPDNLFESELFGYERGAFTGANREGKVGLMEMANKGTLFLDELGDLPLPLQVKLLRALQEHKIIRVGGLKPIEVDIRVIAATNQDLSRLVGEGKFREDLYYRLDVVPVVIPPLRERTEDIPLLAHHLLARFGQRYGRPKEMTTSAMDALVAYPWPGNIRQLENLIERLVVTTLESTISLEHLPESIRRRAQAESLHDKSTEVETIEEGRTGVERGLGS